ncbi:hypothetical protein ONE63_001682 [Megalurothrips usitatus]|uniref:Uncharacterized protein n=1 Tax=Megalurothrips usitatus TaxID=439358 RepID=A0AAV7XD31_9NEOP|nr:hypothetical protein ONE63_001682 [Megalurothrips usitatus]
MIDCSSLFLLLPCTDCSKVPAAGVLAPHVLGVPFGPECSSCEESCAQGVFCVRGTLNRPRVRANGSEMELKIHPGAGFLVKRANAWYLRGIVAFYWPSKENLLAVTDLTTAGVREWLRAGLALSSSKDPPLKPAALNAKE